MQDGQVAFIATCQIKVNNAESAALHVLVAAGSLFSHRTKDPAISIQAGQFLATHIARAKLIELDGPDHIYWVGDNALQIADMIVDFVSGTEARSAAESRRMLATLMFTDIVGSTTRASQLGPG